MLVTLPELTFSQDGAQVVGRGGIGVLALDKTYQIPTQGTVLKSKVTSAYE